VRIAVKLLDRTGFRRALQTAGWLHSTRARRKVMIVAVSARQATAARGEVRASMAQAKRRGRVRRRADTSRRLAKHGQAAGAA